jgi:hypothetical protein
MNAVACWEKNGLFCKWCWSIGWAHEKPLTRVHIIPKCKRLKENIKKDDIGAHDHELVVA